MMDGWTEGRTGGMVFLEAEISGVGRFGKHHQWFLASCGICAFGCCGRGWFSLRETMRCERMAFKAGLQHYRYF